MPAARAPKPRPRPSAESTSCHLIPAEVCALISTPADHSSSLRSQHCTDPTVTAGNIWSVSHEPGQGDMSRPPPLTTPQLYRSQRSSGQQPMAEPLQDMLTPSFISSLCHGLCHHHSAAAHRVPHLYFL
ncbi:hypothetical protein INR49_021477, partial [Caranx melampygus]